MKKKSRTGQYLQSGIHMFMYFLGLSPYNINKETGEVSFKWISCETIWSLVRLVVFNSPFSFLPVVLAGLFGTEEWKKEDLGGFSNVTDTQMSTTTVFLVVSSVEYISTYSFFVLSRAAKSWIQGFQNNRHIFVHICATKITFVKFVCQDTN